MSWFTYFRVVVVLATIQTADFLLEWYHCLLICIRSAKGFRSSLNSWRLVRVCILYAGSFVVKMLCEEELVASIKDKIPDFSIHVSDLKAPTAKFVQSYYVRILEELGVDVDEFKDPSAENLCELDYPEGYRCVLPLANLHGALCYVFKNIYVDDFSVLDLTEPSPRRTQFLIKAMDAFHTFADWKAQSVQDGIEKLQNRVADYDQLRAQAEEMKAKINVCASEQAQREVDKKELHALNEETKRRFLHQKEEDAKLREKITSMEAMAEQQKQKQRQLETELQKLEEEASAVQSKIVTLPAHLQQDLNRLMQNKQEIKAERQKLFELKREKNRQKELHENFIQRQEKCVAKLKDISALCEHLRICEKKKQKYQETQALATETQEMEGKNKKLHMKVTELQEEKMAVNMQWEEEKAALIQSIKEANSELDHLKKLEENLTEVKAKRKEVEGKNKRLIQLNEEQNRIHTKHYEERIAKQDAAIKKIEDNQTQLLERLKKK